MTKDEKSINAEVKPKGDPPSRERSTRQRVQKRDKVKPLTKIIIRHLPPTMTEEEFLKQIDPLPEHDFYYYAAADWSLGFDATCRAYLNCKNYEDVFLFRDRFDGYVFVDSKGSEYPAIVEFAPFQGLAKNKSRKIDPKVNSIEFEQHYKTFLEKLEEDREAAAKGGGESKLEFSLDRKKEEKITSTPLLQYLANKKEKRREESKRRTEEKRRQREEEKERRQRNQQQVTKIMSNQEAGGGGATSGKKDGGSKSAAGGSGVGGSKENAGDRNDNLPGEELKNSRTKRRAARDQRRFEEHKQRKRERERLEREQREQREPGKTSEEAKEKQDTEIGAIYKQENEKKYSNDAKTEDRKEVKKYSERRERDRKRGRKEQEQRASIKDEPATEAPNIEVATTAACQQDEISDSVKNFIRSVATVKEFVPKHKQVEADSNEAVDTKEKNVNVHDIKDNVEKLSIVVSAERKSSEPAEQSKMESAAALEEKQLQKQRLAEERRIRNKDRPSIAIYQPKPRLRQSEESDSKDTKDTRSNPNSDCESLKKEEQQQRAKKPSRYSERRSERRSKDKRKDGNTSEGNADHKPDLIKFKSHEESSDVSEKQESREVANEIN